MPLPKKVQLNNAINKHNKTDNMKDIKNLLEKAQQKLIAAQKANDTERVKQLQKKIAEITGTIQRNS